MISRRCFLIAASGNGLSCACRGALAQDTAKIFKIGLVSPFAPSNTTLWHKAFRLGLRDLGWIDGRNVAIEDRHADGHNDRLDGLIADLIHRKVDVIVCSVTPDAEAAKRATPVIPIVIVSVSDP